MSIGLDEVRAIALQLHNKCLEHGVPYMAAVGGSDGDYVSYSKGAGPITSEMVLLHVLMHWRTHEFEMFIRVADVVCEIAAELEPEAMGGMKLN